MKLSSKNWYASVHADREMITFTFRLDSGKNPWLMNNAHNRYSHNFWWSEKGG
jgi:hypothetical protein